MEVGLTLRKLIVIASRAACCRRRRIFALDTHTVSAHVFRHCLGPRRVKLGHAHHTWFALLRGWQLNSVGESTVRVVCFVLGFALSWGSNDGLLGHYHTSLLGDLALFIALVAIIIVRCVRFPSANSRRMSHYAHWGRHFCRHRVLLNCLRSIGATLKLVLLIFRWLDSLSWWPHNFAKGLSMGLVEIGDQEFAHCSGSLRVCSWTLVKVSLYTALLAFVCIVLDAWNSRRLFFVFVNLAWLQMAANVLGQFAVFKKRTHVLTVRQWVCVHWIEGAFGLAYADEGFTRKLVIGDFFDDNYFIWAHRGSWFLRSLVRFPNWYLLRWLRFIFLPKLDYTILSINVVHDSILVWS